MRNTVTLLAAASLLASLAATPATATTPRPDVADTRAAEVVGRADAATWLVLFAADATDAQIAEAERSAADIADVGRRWRDALVGFELHGSASIAKQLADLPGVEAIESDDPVSSAVVEDPATWGLDRTDQRDRPLDGRYAVDGDGAGVRIYVVDSGIRPTHDEFDDRVLVAEGGTSINDGLGSDDCQGHGTHVAATAAGNTHGVAQQAWLVPVRVLDCDGRGSDVGVVSALDFIAANATLPAVANLSLAGPPSAAIDAAVQGVIDAGVVVTVAAGNDGADACSSSPARTPAALTIAASDRDDESAVFTNRGPCVDLYAPGVDITSAAITNDSSTVQRSGTSMAAPHVAGVAAVALAADSTATPDDIAVLLVGTATPDRIAFEGDSPDLLLHSGRTAADLPDGPNPAPAPPDGCAGHDHTYTSALGPGDVQLLPPLADYVTERRRLHRGCLDGPDGADFDLTLLRYDRGTEAYVVVDRATTTAADEQLDVNTDGGQYAWAVESFSGSGQFQLGYSLDPPSDVGPVDTTTPPCRLDHDTGAPLSGDGDSRVATPVFALGVGDVTRGCLGGPSDADFDLLLQRNTGAGWQTVASSLSVDSSEQLSHTTTAAGDHRWVVSSHSGAGTYSLSWLATPPTEIVDLSVVDDTARAVLRSREAGSTFRCRLDGGPVRACDATARFDRLAEGRHRLEAFAVDGDGNVDPSPAVATFDVDVAEPGRGVDVAEPPAGHVRFEDVTASNVFTVNIGRLAAAGVTKGCNPPTNSRFCPGDPVTRGQMAAFLTRALDLPAAPERFRDVSSSDTFADPIGALAAAGITKGCNPPANDRFCPGDRVTRGQMAAFLTRALDLPAAPERFRDVSSSDTFADPIGALAAAGVTKGCNPPTNDRFCPDQPVTREQMSAFLDRAGLLD